MPAALIKADKSRSEYKSECCNNSVSIRISDCFNSQWQGKPGQRLLSSRWGSFSLTAYQRSKLTALSNQRKRGHRSGEGPGGRGCFSVSMLSFWPGPILPLWEEGGGGEKKKSDLASEATDPTERCYTNNLEWKIRIFMPYVVFSICFLTNINVDSGKQARNSLGTSQFPKHHQPCLAKSRKRDIMGLLKW